MLEIQLDDIKTGKGKELTGLKNLESTSLMVSISVTISLKRDKTVKTVFV